jgi:hypothetical protein
VLRSIGPSTTARSTQRGTVGDAVRAPGPPQTTALPDIPATTPRPLDPARRLIGECAIELNLPIRMTDNSIARRHPVQHFIFTPHVA